jgi:hypothetical protein
MTCQKFCSVSGRNLIKHIFSFRSREGISFFIIIKLSVKSSKHGIGSLCSVDLWDVTSKMVPKNYTHAQWGMQLRFQARLGTNSVSCQVFYLCIARRSSHLGPLLLRLYIHRLHMFTLMFTPWLSGLASALGFPKVFCYSFPPFPFFDSFIHAIVVFFSLQTISL